MVILAKRVPHGSSYRSDEHSDVNVVNVHVHRELLRAHKSFVTRKKLLAVARPKIKKLRAFNIFVWR